MMKVVSLSHPKLLQGKVSFKAFLLRALVRWRKRRKEEIMYGEVDNPQNNLQQAPCHLAATTSNGRPTGPRGMWPAGWAAPAPSSSQFGAGSGLSPAARGGGVGGAGQPPWATSLGQES